MHQIITYCMDAIDININNTGKSSKNQSTASTPSLSGGSKWRSQRAAELKKNPNQKRSYSSKPIHRSDKDRDTHSHGRDSNDRDRDRTDRNRGTPRERDHNNNNNNQSQGKEIIESPTTYKDSRFTRFAQEQQELEQRNSNNPTITNTHSNTPSNRYQNDEEYHQQQHDHGQNIVELEEDQNWDVTMDPNEHQHQHQHLMTKSKKDNENDAKDDGSDEYWWYKDPSGQEQGPFEKQQMAQWFHDGYFPQDLPIRSNVQTPFIQLKDWFYQGMTGMILHCDSDS